MENDFINDIEFSKKGDGTYTFTASQELVDRNGNMVVIAGMDIKNYKANPIVLWNHNSEDLPIGRATKVFKKDKVLTANIEFADENPQAVVVEKLVNAGFLKTVSIGWASDYDSIEYVEDKKAKSQYRKINKSELLEISVVPLPANTKATRKADTKVMFQAAMEQEVITEEEFNMINNVEEDTRDETINQLKDEVAKLKEDLAATEDYEPNWFDELYKYEEDNSLDGLFETKEDDSIEKLFE